MANRELARAHSAHLALLALLFTACSGYVQPTITTNEYTMRQNAQLANPALRAVGDLIPSGHAAIEGGYGRTAVLAAPSREAGGLGVSPSVDMVHLRVGGTARNVEFSGGFEVGLNPQPSAVDVHVPPGHPPAVGVFTAIRGRVVSGSAGAFVLHAEIGANSVPWQRDISVDSSVSAPSGRGGTRYTDAHSSYGTTGSSFTARLNLGLSGILRLTPEASLQLGLTGGMLPGALGKVGSSQRCVDTTCQGSQPDDTSVITSYGYFMPIAALTVYVAPVQFVVSGWWLLASSDGLLEQSTPSGCSGAVRLVF